MIQNPILQGFCPDPSIVRVKEDYYIAVSTFEWWPGVRLFHSRDLEHFEQLPSPLTRVSQLNLMGNPDSCGVWAPDLSYDGERFWLVFTDVKTRSGSRYYNTHNYVVWSKNIKEGWSEPVYLNSTGFDPSLFHEKDGKMYLVNMINGFEGIQIQEFDKEQMCLIKEPVNVCRGTGRGFTEGPHLYHIGEWYYLMMAEGGTSYEHCETMCRSRSLWGPYEEDPGNPILTSDPVKTDALQKCGHADLVQTQKGEWYLVHLCSRPNANRKCVLGRETALQKIMQTQDGWFRLASGKRYGEQKIPDLKEIEKQPFVKLKLKDEWEEKTIGICYNSLRIPAERFASFTDREGYLRLYGKDFLNSHFEVSLLARRQTKFKSGICTCMEFQPESERQAAGVAYFYDSMNFYLFIKSGNHYGVAWLEVLESDGGVVQTIARRTLSEQQPGIFLKIQTDESGEHAEFLYSRDDRVWEKMAETKTDILTDEHCVGFTGAHFGIYCHDMEQRKGYADFQYFELLEGE